MTGPSSILGHFKNSATFTLNDAYLFLRSGKAGVSRTYTQVTLSRMSKRRSLYQVAKGVFSVRNNVEVAGFAFSPFYYGGVSALMIRDLIDDQVLLEIMTTKTVRKSRVKVFGGSANVLLHHIPDRYYFGFDEIMYGGLKVPVSNAEKTLIDLLYFKIRLSEDDYLRLVASIDRKRLAMYLRKFNVRFAKSALSFYAKTLVVAETKGLESGY